ncbi:hypothetical protein [Mesorhizobium sp.]|uniref:hypothetical protein n=1 Tax=Mesorhizobium sp. TaxID=1871066 RepID=UPI00178430F9|nr:hypothetical protein [Mesorhizobium sp.]
MLTEAARLRKTLATAELILKRRAVQNAWRRTESRCHADVPMLIFILDDSSALSRNFCRSDRESPVREITKPKRRNYSCLQKHFFRTEIDFPAYNRGYIDGRIATCAIWFGKY